MPTAHQEISDTFTPFVLLAVVVPENVKVLRHGRGGPEKHPHHQRSEPTHLHLLDGAIIRAGGLHGEGEGGGDRTGGQGAAQVADHKKRA